MFRECCEEEYEEGYNDAFPHLELVCEDLYDAEYSLTWVITMLNDGRYEGVRKELSLICKRLELIRSYLELED